ncbi:TIGR00297 family protein [Rivularia sp. PCC 7116]|uniref:TIGR00297 family protein n=1 Tax=Rivularia sp. PCC 7116 TaxID=373994 RepID=UPI00029EC8E2|nr:TIGR00297 family protein [Rivularia sp. PCC 7116]AFY53484.1 TIGR00297 family protein [Rivularia sp. PCC 7116]
MLSLYDFSNSWLIAAGLNTLLLAIVWLAPKKLLTLAGIVNAWLLGVLIWGTLGLKGYAIVCVYFIVGSGVTRIGMAEKEQLGIAEKRSGARGPENVWGSAFTAALCALGVGIIDWLGTSETVFLSSLLLLGYVASFCTKLSDTCASEVGKAYGERTFLITTLQPVPRGTEGAVSLEGTLAGIFASVVLAILGWGVGLIDVWGIIWCVFAAFIATNLESVIGATLQSRWQWLTNELVNVLNTLIGAATAILFAWMRANIF